MSIFSQDPTPLLKLPNIQVQPLVSQYTFSDFKTLADPRTSYSSPLAVVAHIDVNAFFAQVEQIKHGFSRDDPVICVQWQNIIAVSYPARKYGISRMDTLKSAIKKCPHIIPLHTSVFRKGENFWRNVNSCNPEDFPSPSTHKVSLDPYRRESRKMQRIFRENCQIVEKASVDESFFDLGPEVYQKASELFPQLHEKVLSGNENISDKLLPTIPTELPDYCMSCRGVFIPTTEERAQQGHVAPSSQQEEALALQSSQYQISKPPFIIRDWDDILMIIGSQITLDIRKKVEKALGYTTSCGVARVKTLAKLASGYKKPDNQTIIRNDAIANFLTKFHIVDFWGLGGKLGEHLCSILSVPHDKSQTIAHVRDNFNLDELIAKFDNDVPLAIRVYQLVRGELYTPFSDRKDPSMCSSKRFRGEPVTSREDCVGWLKVFAGDLYQRIKEINEEEFLNMQYRKEFTKRMTATGQISVISSIKDSANNNQHYRTKCPRLLSLQYTVSKTRVSRSKQMPIPQCSLEGLETLIFESGVRLLDEVLMSVGSNTDHFFPLGLMSLTVSKFEVMSEMNFINNFFKSSGSNTTKDDNSGSGDHGLDVQGKESINVDMGGDNSVENIEPFVYGSRKQAKRGAVNDIHNMLKVRASLSVSQAAKVSKLPPLSDIESKTADAIGIQETMNVGQKQAESTSEDPLFVNGSDGIEKSLTDQAHKGLDIDNTPITDFFCHHCDKIVKNVDGKPKFRAEHNDYHFAIKYSDMLNGEGLTEHFLGGGPHQEDLPRESIFKNLGSHNKKREKKTKPLTRGRSGSITSFTCFSIKAATIPDGGAETAVKDGGPGDPGDPVKPEDELNSYTTNPPSSPIVYDLTVSRSPSPPTSPVSASKSSVFKEEFSSQSFSNDEKPKLFGLTTSQKDHRENSAGNKGRKSSGAKRSKSSKGPGKGKKAKLAKGQSTLPF